MFFAANGINVTAIDASEVAIEDLSALNIANAKFVCGNFVDSTEIYSQQYNHCYARFSLHAITETQERLLLVNVKKSLKADGKFFVEVRSVHDELFGKGTPVGEKNCFIHDGHFRRFIDKSDFEKRLRDGGYKIIFSEESTEFAPFGDSKPPVIRIIATV